MNSRRRSFLITLLAGVVALAVPLAAWATTNIFWNGNIPILTNKQTSSHQFRYGKGLDWSPTSRCAKMWYRNNGTTADYAVKTYCDGTIRDSSNTFPSTETTWAYCRNNSTSGSISATCWTCVSNDVGC